MLILTLITFTLTYDFIFKPFIFYLHNQFSVKKQHSNLHFIYINNNFMFH